MKRLLIIANEPTPYMTDQYNALADRPGWSVEVYYPTSRNRGPDSGHDFRLFPRRRYAFSINQRDGWALQWAGWWTASRLIIRRPDLVLVNGYTSMVHAGVLAICLLLRVPFLFFGDYFNVEPPRSGPARFLRRLFRHLAFQGSVAVLTCGRMGVRSAIESGCPPSKVLDLPYAVDAHRMQDLADGFEREHGPRMRRAWPTQVPKVLFSGRLIQRKGLDTLLAAMQILKAEGVAFFLLIEGDGPLRSHYDSEVVRLGLAPNSAFLGFAQMDCHAWLLAQADVVVVPSLHDPWGLAVPEAMLTGRAVVASDAVGSAVDRIVDGENGLMFSAGDVAALATALRRLLSDSALRTRLGHSSLLAARERSPERNAAVLFAYLEKHGFG